VNALKTGISEMTRFRVSDHDIRQPGQAAWRVLVNEKQAQETAISMITRIAKRLARHDNWYEDVRKARAQVQPSGIRLWRPTSLSSGYAGMALFFGYYAAAEPGCGWERLARDYMSRASRATSDEPLRHCGLYGGSAGLAFVLLCLAELDDRYIPAALSALENVAGQVLQRPGWRHDGDALADERDFDVINGDAGVLTVLLTHSRPSPAVEKAIRALISNLVAFCRPATGTGSRSWRVRPPERLGDKFASWHNLGLAHGVLGAAAALAMAIDHGYDADGVTDAAGNVYSWVSDWIIRDSRGVHWPDGVAAEIDNDPLLRQRVRSRLRAAPPTWCYGAPGGARALWLGGAVLRESALCQSAVGAIESAAGRRLGNSGLCHGLAGLLVSCLRFAHDVPDTTLRGAIPRLTAELIGMCDPDRPFFAGDPDHGEADVAEPGLLTGIAGVGLALLAATSPVAPRWDRAMLMSGWGAQSAFGS